MPSRFVHGLKTLELEEQIINGSALVTLISLFLPWLGGERAGEDHPIRYTGFQHYTALIGIAIFLLILALLLATLVPLLGGPVILRRRHRDGTRLALSGQATILILASLSVLLQVTRD